MQNIPKKILKINLGQGSRGKKPKKFEEEIDIKIHMKTLFNL